MAHIPTKCEPAFAARAFPERMSVPRAVCSLSTPHNPEDAPLEAEQAAAQSSHHKIWR